MQSLIDMRTEIKDLRLLKMAAFYEQANERFMLAIARRITQDAAIRNGLEQLSRSGESQRRLLKQAMEAQAKTLTPQDHQDLVVAALLDVRDMERAARDLYFRLLDEAHDEEVAVLFRKNLREEEEHIRIIDELVYRAERTATDLRGREAAPYAESLQFLHDLEILLEQRSGLLQRA